MSYTLMKYPIKLFYYPLPWETGKAKGQKEELKTYICQMAYASAVANYANVLSTCKYIYFSPFENCWILNYGSTTANQHGLQIVTTPINIINNNFDGFSSFRSWRSSIANAVDIIHADDGSFWLWYGYPGIAPIGTSTLASLKFASILPTINLVQNGTGIFDGRSGSFTFNYLQPTNNYRRSQVNGLDLDVLFDNDDYKDADGVIDDICGCYINSSNAKIYVGNDFFKINGELDEPENYLWIGTTGAANYLNFLNEDGSVETSQYYSHRGVDYNLDYRIDYFYRYTSSLHPNLVTGWYLTDFSKFYETLESEKGVYKFTTTPSASNSNQTNTYTLTWVKLTDDAPDKSDITISYKGSSRRNCYSYLVNGSKDFTVNVPFTAQEVLV